MKLINSNETNSTPKIELDEAGNCIIEGKSYPEDATRVYDPLIKCLKGIKKELVTMYINLIYFNTATSKKLMEAFTKLEDNASVKNVKIKWFYEKYDEDSIDMAQIFQENLDKVKFEYQEYAEDVNYEIKLC